LSAASGDVGVLGLTIALTDDRWYRADEDIPFRVTMKNETAEELLACVEHSPVQKKLITFRLHDDTGTEVTSQPRLQVDYGVTIDEDTVLLPALGAHVGTVRLEREYLPRDQGCRTFSVVAVYHCPLNAEEVIGGRRLRVANGLLTSAPVSVRVDSRSWLKRVFGGDCR
jgi:hypothetical protein